MPVLLRSVPELCRIQEPDPAAMFDFNDRFTLHLLEFFKDNTLKSDIPVVDMAISRKDKNLSGLNDRLKMIKDV